MCMLCPQGAVSGVEEEEEEREVDPSLVGSLDNILPEEQPGSLTDDSFKKAPVMDKELASSSEMEKTADALVVYSQEGDDCLSPMLLDVNGCGSPRDEQEDNCFQMSAATDFNESRQDEQITWIFWALVTPNLLASVMVEPKVTEAQQASRTHSLT